MRIGGHYPEYKIFAGNSNDELVNEIASIMGKPLGRSSVSRFSDGEISVSVHEIVRGRDIFIIQSTCDPVNNNLMELLIMIDAMKRASAGCINAVIPYFGYARQDRKANPRDPITAKLVADIISSAGADRVVTMDLHAAQIQGYFDIPVDHLFGLPVLVKYFKKKKLPEVVIVSPDHGSTTRARQMAHQLDVPIAIVDKRRQKANESEVMNIVGEIEGKTCILVDDLIDTAGTITHSANKLMDMGALGVYAAATHAVLSGDAVKNIQESAIKEMVLLNTIPIGKEKMIAKFKILSVASIFAEAMNNIHNNESVSKMFP